MEFRRVLFRSVLRDPTAGLENRMKIANKVRTYEIALSRKYKGGEFKPENLWDSEEELEFLEINNMGDLANAIQRGAPKPPQSLIEFIRNGGSTSIPDQKRVV